MCYNNFLNLLTKLYAFVKKQNFIIALKKWHIHFLTKALCCLLENAIIISALTKNIINLDCRLLYKIGRYIDYRIYKENDVGRLFALCCAFCVPPHKNILISCTRLKAKRKFNGSNIIMLYAYNKFWINLLK